MGIDWSSARLSTNGGIPYKLVSGPTFTANEDGASAREMYLMRGTDIEDFFVESLPPPLIFGGLVVKLPRRALPGSSLFFTSSISFEPHTGETPGDPLEADAGAVVGTYDRDYLATIDYELTLADDDDEDPNDPETFLEHSVQAAGEFLNLPTSNLTSQNTDAEGGGDGAETPFRPSDVVSKVVANLEHTLSWKHVINPDWRTIIRALGKVNNAALPIFFDAPDETVLFVGVSGRQEYLWNGRSSRVKPWSLDFKFHHKEIEDDGRIWSWQHAWQGTQQGWGKVLRPGGRDLYETTDFLALFRPATS